MTLTFWTLPPYELPRQKGTVGLNVPMDNVVVMAVLQGQQYLPHVVAAHWFRVDETGRGPLDDLEAQVRTSHELEHHVQHALGAVGLEKLHDMRVLEHVANRGLPFEVVQTEAGARGELGHIDDFDCELLACLAVHASSHEGKGTLACKVIIIHRDLCVGLWHLWRKVFTGWLDSGQMWNSEQNCLVLNFLSKVLQKFDLFWVKKVFFSCLLGLNDQN